MRRISDDSDTLAWWRTQERSWEVVSRDGREWTARIARVGVPRPVNWSPYEVLAMAVGWLYHLAFHRGLWRFEVEADNPRPRRWGGLASVWVIGVYPEQEARATAAASIWEMEAGRWYPDWSHEERDRRFLTGREPA